MHAHERTAHLQGVCWPGPLSALAHMCFTMFT